MSYADVVKAKGSAIETEGLYDDTSKVADAAMCAQIAEVEVDPETGNVELKRLITSHSTGTILNPLMHQGQIEGASMTGIGYGLMEHLMVDDGKVTTANFGDYKIPTIRDVPGIEDPAIGKQAGPRTLQQHGHRRDRQHPHGGSHRQRRGRRRRRPHHVAADHLGESVRGVEPEELAGRTAQGRNGFSRQCPRGYAPPLSSSGIPPVPNRLISVNFNAEALGHFRSPVPGRARQLSDQP